MQSVGSRNLLRCVARSTCTIPRTRGCHRAFASVVDQSQDPVEYDMVSTLSNGVRVATEALPGPFAAVGAYIDAGSRYETQELSGVSHIVDRLAFKSTSSRTSDEMLETIDSLGGNIQCASSRESLMYQAATFNAAIPKTVQLLAETIRDPLITETEVAQQLETADYEVREISSKPELILPELFNVAAYKGNTLGNPLLCPPERLPFINKSVVEKYRRMFFHPERVVLAFAGVRHEEALKLADQYFGDWKRQHTPDLLQTSSTAAFDYSPKHSSYSSPNPSFSSQQRFKAEIRKHLSTSAYSKAQVVDGELPLQMLGRSRYTGGFLALPNLPPPMNPTLPDLSYIHLGFEALPISSDEIYALATLQTLLGGGGSFSAGGPGKGMYSRLYTNVLNQHGWVESCIAFNNSYTDSGLFGISASCHPRQTNQMLDIMCRELHDLTVGNGYSAMQIAEVNRAKNQLRSSLLMNLESRMVELEDLGRQVQVHGRKVGVKEMCQKIDSLTIEDLRKTAIRVLRSGVRNPGMGSGAPCVVLQEGASAPPQLMNWNEMQQRIEGWKLGMKWSD